MVAEIYPATPENRRFYSARLRPLVLKKQLITGNFLNPVYSVVNSLDGETSQKIVKTDITNFFESIPRNELLKAAEEISNEIGCSVSEFVSTCYKQKDRKIFLPVGYASSPFISEWIIHKNVVRQSGLKIRRYVDDILILAGAGSFPGEFKKEYIFSENVSSWINLSKTKTIVYDEKYTNGQFYLQYLGSNFSVHKGSFKLLSPFSNSTMKKYNHIFSVIGKQLARQRVISDKLISSYISETEITPVTTIERSGLGEGIYKFHNLKWALESDPHTGTPYRRSSSFNMKEWAKNNLSSEDYSLFNGFVKNKYATSVPYAREKIEYFYDKELRNLLLQYYGINYDGDTISSPAMGFNIQ